MLFLCGLITSEGTTVAKLQENRMKQKLSSRVSYRSD
jgi:hypothetical protein